MNGRGYTRDAAAKRTQKPVHLLHAAMRLAAAPSGYADLRSYECPILDQGQTSSCLGHGTAQGLYTAFGAAGMALPWIPSPKEIYDTTRAVARENPKASLLDLGGMPSDTMAAIAQWGIRPIGDMSPDLRISDVTIENVNDEPDFFGLEQASTKLVAGEYRIDETAGDVIDKVCLTLDAGVPVGIGAFVSSEFENWMPGDHPIGLPNFNDPAGGGHWVVASGYVTVSGARIFRITNSWSQAWGDAGHALVSAAWVAAAYDLYALNVVRK